MTADRTSFQPVEELDEPTAAAVHTEQGAPWDLELPMLGRIPCPVCGHPIGAVRGSRAAVCSNCGFKDSCC